MMSLADISTFGARFVSGMAYYAALHFPEFDLGQIFPGKTGAGD
jgi:hypothetical protein